MAITAIMSLRVSGANTAITAIMSLRVSGANAAISTFMQQSTDPCFDYRKSIGIWKPAEDGFFTNREDGSLINHLVDNQIDNEY
jgi:hypothetical protein